VEVKRLQSLAMRSVAEEDLFLRLVA
jgi:hypothetical protein